MTPSRDRDRVPEQFLHFMRSAFSDSMSFEELLWIKVY